MTVYMTPVHKPPAVRRQHRPMVMYGEHRQPIAHQPIYLHPEFYGYQRYARHSRAVSWLIGMIGFFGSFVLCCVHPAITIAGWGLTIAILSFRAIRD
jgi:hypothetical protein